MPNKIYSVDASLTMTLAHCAYEAYYPTRHTPPPGYTYHSQWTGKNPSYFLGGDVEPYGLVFQGDTPSTQSEFIFAFKGTATKWDAFEDLFAEHAEFVAHNNTTPSSVEVSAGFNAIYSTAVSDSVPSMQDQLFNLIDTLKPTKLLITGHSLGSALAELFRFDLYISTPTPSFTIQQYNFACPRVGNSDYADAYMNFEKNVSSANRTVRIVNFKDYIPCLPFKLWGYYEHGSDYFMIDFDDANGSVPSPGIRHSMYNYSQALKKIVVNSPQEYAGEFDGLHYQLESYIQDKSVTECSFSLPDEIMNLAIKMGAKHPNQNNESNKGCLNIFGFFK